MAVSNPILLMKKYKNELEMPFFYLTIDLELTWAKGCIVSWIHSFWKYECTETTKIN